MVFFKIYAILKASIIKERQDFMSKYTGIHCPVCNKVFEDNDDIVVCPECGAPHHRECYQSEGHCHFESEHATMKSWKRPDEETINGHDILKCPNCGCKNPPENIFCDICGASLKRKSEQELHREAYNNFPNIPPISPNPYTTPFAGLDPAEEIRGISIKDWAMFFGDKAFYFLPRLKAMQINKFFINTNWAAFLTSFFYYFYRKMYLVGAILLSMFVISYVPMVYVVFEYLKDAYAANGMTALMSIDVNAFMSFTQAYEGLLTFSSAARNIAFLSTAVLSVFANKIYFKTAESKIKALREKYKDDRDYSQSLAKHGRTSTLAVILVAVCIVVAFIASSNLMVFLLIK